jgi:hypothetical protein
VATDSSGDFVIVWESYGPQGGIVGQRYASTGARLGFEFQVNANIYLGPAVASDSAGNFIVVWESNVQDGYAEGVFGQRYGKIAPGPSWQGLTDPVEPME